jgi:hypothetical protein
LIAGHINSAVKAEKQIKGLVDDLGPAIPAANLERV